MTDIVVLIVCALLAYVYIKNRDIFLAIAFSVLTVLMIVVVSGYKL